MIRPLATLVIAGLAFAVALTGVSRLGAVYGVFSDGETAHVSVAAGSVEPPGDLACRFVHLFQAELHWSPATTEGVQGYRVYHRGPWPWSQGFRRLAEVPGPASDSYDGLRPSLLRHRYYVTSYLNEWESDASNTAYVHCRPRLFHFPGPCCLRGENHHSQRSVELTWGGVMGAASYAVLRGSEPGGPYELLASTDAPGFTDGAVADGVTYYYVVVALDAAGNESDPSAEVAVPDLVPTTPPAPTATTTPTPVPAATSTPTATGTPAPTSTGTPLPTATNTPMPTATSTATPTPTSTPTSTPTWTPSPTPTFTFTPTSTPTATVTSTPTFAVE